MTKRDAKMMLELADEIARILDNEVYWDRDRQEIDYGDAVKELMNLRATAAAPVAVRAEPVEFINKRLEDLAEANALYGKDQRLGTPDKIARNDREISWLKDLRSILHFAPSLPTQPAKSVPVLTSSHNSGEADPSVMPDCAGTGTLTSEAIATIIRRHVRSEADAHFVDRRWLVGVSEAATEIAAALPTQPARDCKCPTPDFCRKQGKCEAEECLAPPQPAREEDRCAHIPIIGLNGKWCCARCNEPIELAFAQSPKAQEGGR